MTEEVLRDPPHAVESEQAVIGSLLLFPDAIDRVEWLTASMFFRAAHREIYGVIRTLIEANKPVDALIVSERLRAVGKLTECGGGEYLGQLVGTTPSAANLVRHAEIVRDKHRLRSLISHASAVMDEAMSQQLDANAIAEQAEARFMTVLDDRQDSDEVAYSVCVAEAVDRRDMPQQGISTGYQRLDRVLKGGLRPDQLIIIAGRPSMGKSALAFNIAEHIAKTGTVAAFSLEMNRAEIADRSIEWFAHQLGSTSDAVLRLMELKMFVDHTPSITIGHLRLRSRRIKRKHGLSLIVVDYLQLMRGQGENRTQEIGSISRGLKAIAKELHVPVIAVAQINRGAENRTDRRPLLSDLREAGDIEQDADAVLMLYRDDYYNPNSLNAGLAECIVRKNRNGPTATVPLEFRPQYTRFLHTDENLQHTEAAPQIGRVKTVDFKSRSAGE